MENRQHLTPILSEEVAKDTKYGVYEIPAPTEEKGEMVLDGKEVVPVIRLACHSLYTHRPDTVMKCNSVVKTVVSGGSGDQTEIVECGKCRTSYLIRTRYDEKGNPIITSAVWDIGRNVSNYCRKHTGKNGEYLVKFNR